MWKHDARLRAKVMAISDPSEHLATSIFQFIYPRLTYHLKKFLNGRISVGVDSVLVYVLSYGHAVLGSNSGIDIYLLILVLFLFSKFFFSKFFLKTFSFCNVFLLL